MIFDFLKQTANKVHFGVQMHFTQMHLSYEGDERQFLYQNRMYQDRIDGAINYEELLFQRVKINFENQLLKELIKELGKSQKIGIIHDFKKFYRSNPSFKLFLGDPEYLGYLRASMQFEQPFEEQPFEFMTTIPKNIVIVIFAPIIGSYSVAFEKETYSKKTRIDAFFNLDCDTFSIFKIVKDKYFHIFTWKYGI